GGTAAWYLPDREGSTRDLIDNSGVVQDTITYDGFGAILSESNAGFGDRFKYTGGQYDPETGWQYNHQHYYDAKTGRWTTQDPLGLSFDVNVYRYVHNGPTNATDPSGLAAPPTVTTVSAPIGGAGEVTTTEHDVADEPIRGVAPNA